MVFGSYWWMGSWGLVPSDGWDHGECLGLCLREGLWYSECLLIRHNSIPKNIVD